ncbi:MAG: hypothetical protein ACRDZ1_17625 [Acidimicrobiia bacterium]|jgi:hypothetical protein
MNDDLAPSIRFEPCAGFRLYRDSVGHDQTWAVCLACGWPEDDHDGPDDEAAVASVAELRVSRTVLRRAS